MTTGIMRPPPLGGFLVSGGRDPPAANLIKNDRNWWADLRLLHPTLIKNVAKMPTGALLLM